MSNRIYNVAIILVIIIVVVIYVVVVVVIVVDDPRNLPLKFGKNGVSNS